MRPLGPEPPNWPCVTVTVRVFKNSTERLLHPPAGAPDRIGLVALFGSRLAAKMTQGPGFVRVPNPLEFARLASGSLKVLTRPCAPSDSPARRRLRAGPGPGHGRRAEILPYSSSLDGPETASAADWVTGSRQYLPVPRWHQTRVGVDSADSASRSDSEASLMDTPGSGPSV